MLAGNFTDVAAEQRRRAIPRSYARSTEAAVRSSDPIEAAGSGPGALVKAEGWAGALAVYRQPRLVAILLMGFSSGLPAALTFGTLFYWLAEIGVSLAPRCLVWPVRTSVTLS